MDTESPEHSERRFTFLQGGGETGAESLDDADFILEQEGGELADRSEDEDSEFILGRLAASQSLNAEEEGARKLKRDTKAAEKQLKQKHRKRKRQLRHGAFAGPHADLLVRLQRQIDFYFSDENLLYDEHMRYLLLRSRNVPLIELLSFPRLASLLAPIESTAQKIEAMRRAVERTPLDSGSEKPRSKQVTLSRDRDALVRRVAFDKSGVKQDEIDLRSAYLEGFQASTTPEDLARYLEAETGIQPVHVRVIHTAHPHPHPLAYGFLVFATEQHAIHAVRELRSRDEERLRILLKSEWLSVRNRSKQLVKDMLVFYEDSHIFAQEEQEQLTAYHECLPANPFARVRGLTTRVSTLNLKQAIMHYEQPQEISHTPGSEEAIVRFRTNKEAKLFLGKCSALKLFGETLSVEELKMDEAAELLKREKEKEKTLAKRKEMEKQHREGLRMKEMLSQVLLEEDTG